MGRNLVLLGATLFVFSLVSCGLGWHAEQGGAGTLPGDGAMWRGVAFVLLFGAMASAAVGSLLTLYGQVRQKHEQQRDREQRYGDRRIK